MSTTVAPAISLAHLTFVWPDGTLALRDLSAALTPGHTGLIGPNGTGKTTLLRLIAGDLRPTSGEITRTAEVGYLPQDLTLRTDLTVAQMLGVSEKLQALHAIESGDSDIRHFDALDDDWNVEARCRSALARIGLHDLALDRRVGTLSGGETVLAAIAGQQIRGNTIVLLDEPTNNLDVTARTLVYDAVVAWKGTLVVVSHDIELLNLMDSTAELRDGDLVFFGGNYAEYQAHVATEQEAAERALRSAEQHLKKEQRQRIDAQTKIARRQRSGRTDQENKRMPKIIMNGRKQDSEVSAGKMKGQLQASVDAAKAAVVEQEKRVRRDPSIAIALPDPDVPAGKRLAEICDTRGNGLLIQGPQRIALTGANGIGKTRLLETLIHPEAGSRSDLHMRAFTDRIGYLPQRLSHVNDAQTILSTVLAAAPDVASEEVRAQLAKFLFRGDVIYRKVGELSGGERFRVALATLLLAVPAHQLLILDEPTNNLDLKSIAELLDAFSAYRGGVIVVSHDETFLERFGIDIRVTLDTEGLTVDRFRRSVR